MHLLVLSAFRQAIELAKKMSEDNKSQCTFWCSVLSDWLYGCLIIFGVFLSQCTFWCSVLSDLARWPRRRSGLRVSMHLLVLSAFRPGPPPNPNTTPHSLNAPFGAQCFPTSIVHQAIQTRGVSMHLLVLSAFRLVHRDDGVGPVGGSLNAPFGAQCFPTLIQPRSPSEFDRSQCTFWCSVLSDKVFMLLFNRARCLNAPFGAQCFPTSPTLFARGVSRESLNAPFGAQCFPTIDIFIA